MWNIPKSALAMDINSKMRLMLGGLSNLMQHSQRKSKIKERGNYPCFTMYKRISVGLIFISLAFPQPSFSKLNFGVINAVKKKTGELKKKIAEDKAKISRIEATTDSGGIATFILPSGNTVGVKVLSQRTGDPIPNINAVLITDGTEGAYFLVDPEGVYAPRIVNASSEVVQTLNGSVRPLWIGLIKEVGLVAYGRLQGDYPEALTSDRIPPFLHEYIIETFFAWWRDTELSSLNITIAGIITDDAIGSLFDPVINIFIDKIALGISNPVGLVVTAWEMVTSLEHQAWAWYYYNQGCSDNDVMEIYRPNSIGNIIFGRSAALIVIVIPKEPLPQWVVTAKISGKITNAQTGFGLDGVEVSLIPGAKQTTTDSNGNYSFSNVPVYSNMIAPYYTIEALKTGYDRGTILNIQVAAGVTNSNNNLAMNPISAVGSGEFRIVLEWGTNPSDLDSHLFTPSIGGTEYHIYFSNKCDVDYAPYAELDVDDTNSYGPETITIKQFYSGTYTYAVKHYAGTATISSSGAIVKIYDSIGLLKTYYPPSGATGTGDFWTVFIINGNSQVITEINTIDDSVSSLSIGRIKALKALPEKK